MTDERDPTTALAAPPVAQGEYEGLIERLSEIAATSSSGTWAETCGHAADALAALQAESAQARLTLAHTDIGGLPNDWTLQQIAEARIDDLLKLRDQVRDTCRRAETAEARIALAKGGENV